MRLKSPNAAARVCVLVSFCVLVATAVMAVPAHAALPEARVYEMVSPPDKGGQSVEIPGAALDGEAVVFVSNAVFAEAPEGLELSNVYFSKRMSSGWVTSSANPPATLGMGTTLDYSPDFARAISIVGFASIPGAPRAPWELAFYVRDEPGGVFLQATPLMHPVNVPEQLWPAAYESASADLSRLILQPSRPLLPSDTLKDGTRLYEVSGAGGSSPTLSLVGPVGVETVLGGVVPGSGSVVSRFHAVSRDGLEVFFSTYPGGELFVRVNGADNVLLSLHGSFQGASVDGSKVFFTEGGSLYEDEIEAGVVTRQVLISDATVGVARISDDGSHVYFVSSQRIPGLLNGLDQEAVAGAENLYVYDTLTPETKFVAELCSGLETSGSVHGVAQCPGGGSDERLWGHIDERPVQTNGCREGVAACEAGRFLVFDTYAQLIRTGPEADKDAALDVYRYDAQTGGIVRVSIGLEGHDNNGNGAYDATITSPRFLESKLMVQYETRSRAVSDDGSRIVFTTAEPLSEQAINGQPDVYVWHEGQLGLISDGRSVTGDSEPVITPSGRDVFFVSGEGLVPQDTDGVADVYDARIAGGFPVAPEQAGGCSGAACQGPPSVPQLLAPPASATFSGLGNPAPPSAKPAVKKAVVKPLTNAQKLTGALRACKKKPKSRRKGCESQARKRYARKASRSGGRA